MRDIVFVTVFIILCFFVPGRPWFGALLMAWLGYMNPQRLCYGFAFSAPFVAIVTCLTFGSMIFSAEPNRVPWTRESVLLLVFIVWMNVTFLFALNPEGAMGEWQRCMKIQMLIFVTMVLITSEFRINALVWTIALSLAFYGVKGSLFAIASGGHYRVQGPESTFIEDNNNLALALTMAIPLLRYLQLVTSRYALRLALSGVIMSCFFAVMASYSRAGFVALATVGAMMILKSRRRFLFGATMVLAVCVMFAFMPQEWHERIQSINGYEKDASALGRINAWRFALNIAAERPILGGGYKVFTKPLFLIYAPEPRNHHDAHSIYMQVLAEQGYPGLILFILLGFFTWRTASSLRRSVRDDPSLKWIGDLMSMCQVSMIGYAIGGAFVTLAYFDLPYHLLAIVVICKRYAVGRQLASSELPAVACFEAAAC